MKTRLKDIIILLPGITGSVLQKDGKDVWALSGQALWQALISLGGSLQTLKLSTDDPDIDDLGDGVRATRLMPNAHLVPGLVKIDGYASISRLITCSFEVKVGHIEHPEPANFLQFPYDWRRDNRVAARRLRCLIEQRLPQWRDYCGYQDAKVILLAHSMGGLIARYYLEVLDLSCQRACWPVPLLVCDTLKAKSTVSIHSSVWLRFYLSRSCLRLWI